MVLVALLSCGNKKAAIVDRMKSLQTDIDFTERQLTHIKDSKDFNIKMLELTKEDKYAEAFKQLGVDELRSSHTLDSLKALYKDLDLELKKY